MATVTTKTVQIFRNSGNNQPYRVYSGWMICYHVNEWLISKSVCRPPYVEPPRLLQFLALVSILHSTGKQTWDVLLEMSFLKQIGLIDVFSARGRSGRGGRGGRGKVTTTPDTSIKPICFNCGKEGHLKSVCRSNAVSTQQQEVSRAVAAQRKEACTRTSK